MDRKMLSVIVPAYEEGHHIYRNLLRIHEELCTFCPDHEIIVVDDGSKDSTLSESRRAASEISKIKVVSSGVNMGKGNAIRLGFTHATKGLVTFIDGDLDIPPVQLKLLLDVFHKTYADVVIQSKHHPGSQVSGFPLKRQILSRSYSSLIKILYGLPVSDTQVGIKLFRREVLERVMPKMLVKRYAFDVEQLVLAHKYNFRIVECPVHIDFKPEGDNMKLKDIVKIAIDTAAIFYRLNILNYYDQGESVGRPVLEDRKVYHVEDFN
jgi:glycosyltransferase involved in cell wall biosynthesis